MKNYEGFKNELREQVTLLTEHEAAIGPGANVVEPGEHEDADAEEELSPELEATLEDMPEEQAHHIFAVMGKFKGGQRRGNPRGQGGRF